VPFLQTSDKPALLDEQLQLRNTQVAWAAIGVLSLPLAAHVLFLPNVVSGLMVALLKRQENAIDRALADPPRDDFATSTRARSRRYIAGHLGGDELGDATDEVAVVTLRSAAYLEAMVRADERAQGARTHGRLDLEHERLLEAARMVDGFKAASWVRANALERLSFAFAASSQREQFGQPQSTPVTAGLPPIVDARSLMSASTLDAVRRTGLVLKDLDLRVSVPRMPSGRSKAVLDVLQATSRLARTTRGAITIAERLAPLRPQQDFDDATAVERAADVERALAHQREDFEEYDELYEVDAFAARTGDAAAATQLADDELNRGRFESARRWFEIASASGSAQAQTELGAMLLAQGDVLSAEKVLRVVADTGDLDALVDLAALLARTQRISEARSLYERAIDRRSAEAALGLALLLGQQGDYEAAERLLQRATKLRAQTDIQ